jgi:staphylococcal nuclease domain-containing protein 1
MGRFFCLRFNLSLNSPTVNEYSANQSSHAREYFEAEKAAKAAKKGLWSIEGALDEEEAEASADGTTEQHKWARVAVSELVSGSEFFAQVIEGDMEDRLNELMKELKVAGSEAADGTHQPRVGELVSAKFSGDGQWWVLDSGWS